MTSDHPPRKTRVRTPHLTALTGALAARDHDFEVLGPDVVSVFGLAPDDLGWLVAAAGVVVYEMVSEEGPDP